MFEVEPAEPAPERLPPTTFDRVRKIFAPVGLTIFALVKWGAKLKLVAPLLKFVPIVFKTGGSMVLTIGLYALSWGFWFAFGFVLLILVHECGHLVAARRVGLKVGAPVFIPFMGAFIALKEAPKDAWIEAQVGIGGPLLGTAGALACDGVYLATGNPMFRALAHTGYFLNLFNLAPFGFLDGGRVAAALSPWLWLVGAGVIVTMLVTHFNFLLLIILVMCLPQLRLLFRKKTDEEQRYYEVAPPRRMAMAAIYFGLLAFLVWGMANTRVEPPPRPQSPLVRASHGLLLTPKREFL